jgi:protein-S-isoprenylcysteine O-methyltransferase Ste14
LGYLLYCRFWQKLAIEREERHVQARFGKTYVDYTERVRRWI